MDTCCIKSTQSNNKENILNTTRARSACIGVDTGKHPGVVDRRGKDGASRGCHLRGGMSQKFAGNAVELRQNVSK
jgi:hypothetical protein